MTNNIDTLIQLLKIYTPIEDLAFIKEITPLVTCSFLTIYSVLLITDGYYFLVFLIVGFGLGAFYFSNNNGNLKIEQYNSAYNIEQHTLEQFSNSLEPVKDVELFYPPLTIVVNQLLDHVMRDFILSWWTPINLHKDPTFEKLARERLNIVFLNVQKILLNQDRNDIVMSTVYGVANTLIIHMRECRAFEGSNLSMNHYVIENPQSPFSQLLSKEEQHRQLRILTQSFLKRTLPCQDKDSLLLMSLFKELLANFVFESILDNISDPNFLNEWIIHLLSSAADKTAGKTPATEAIASTISAAVIAEATITSEPQQMVTINTSLSTALMEEVTPPNTPEPQRVTKSTTQKLPTTTTTMVFSKGSVNFTIMDISAPQQPQNDPNKSELVYIIQIERPAMQDLPGSEGGGYVITRTYADFESFNTILYARHAKRASKLQLRLPLDATTKSWLKSSSQQKKKKFPLDGMCPALEKYVDLVVQDTELGTDPIILPFLRKETRSEVGIALSFAEEFKEETMAAHVTLTGSRSTSLFSRNNSSNTTLAATTSPKTEVEETTDRQSIDQQENNSNKWFARKTRTGSISSLQSNLSSSVTDNEEETSPSSSSKKFPSEPSPLVIEETTTRRDINNNNNTPLSHNTNKALSAMDVELLIETTYALIVEIFNLTTSNNKAWMRRSILNLLREIVRRTYAEFIAEQYNDFVNAYMSPDALVSILNKMGEQFWPEGKWMLDGKQKTKRTKQDKEKSRQLARTMLMTEVIPNAVRQLIGDQNCNTAMDRIWARIQDPELNRVLILQVLERIIKPILG